MQHERAPSPGLDFFWEQADREASTEHPLERELVHRLDVLERYRGMIMDAQAGGRDEIVDALLTEHDRQARVVLELRDALRRFS